MEDLFTQDYSLDMRLPTLSQAYGVPEEPVDVGGGPDAKRRRTDGEDVDAEPPAVAAPLPVPPPVPVPPPRPPVAVPVAPPAPPAPRGHPDGGMRAKKAVGPVYDYTPLRDAKPNFRINVYCVVIDVSCPRKSSGSDFFCAVRVWVAACVMVCRGPPPWARGVRAKSRTRTRMHTHAYTHMLNRSPSSRVLRSSPFVCSWLASRIPTAALFLCARVPLPPSSSAVCH